MMKETLAQSARLNEELDNMAGGVYILNLLPALSELYAYQKKFLTSLRAMGSM